MRGQRRRLWIERRGDAGLRRGAARQGAELGLWSSQPAQQGRSFDSGIELVRRGGAWNLLGRGGSPLDGGGAGSSGVA